MPRVDCAVQVKGGQQVKDLSKAIKQLTDPKQKAKLQREMNQGIRKAAEPLLTDLRRTIRTMPVKGDRRAYGHLRVKKRNRIASATVLQIRRGEKESGIRVIVDRRRLGRTERALPFLLERGQWRHPVHGNREEWVTQKSPIGPWFAPAVRRHEDAMTRAVTQVLNQVAAKLKGVARG